MIIAIPIQTVVGIKMIPITERALLQIGEGNIKQGIHIWKRLLDAKRAYRKQPSARTHEAMREYAKVDVICLILCDLYGMAPPFWEMEALDTIKR